jgi:hypothetical protein
MFFGVFDFTFVVWMFVGAVSVLVVLGAKEWFKDADITMSWWKWLIFVIWYLILMMGLAAPFTLMGEGEVSAGWKMLLFSIPVLIITGFVVYRILKIGTEKKKEA